MTHTPTARRDRLIVRELENETLVYDQANDEAHCLNQTAALVWKHCDGRTTVDEIVTSLGAELTGSSRPESCLARIVAVAAAKGCCWNEVQRNARRSAQSSDVIRPCISRRELALQVRSGDGHSAPTSSNHRRTETCLHAASCSPNCGVPPLAECCPPGCPCGTAAICCSG